LSSESSNAALGGLSLDVGLHLVKITARRFGSGLMSTDAAVLLVTR
jgi:hypothetical protein